MFGLSPISFSKAASYSQEDFSISQDPQGRFFNPLFEAFEKLDFIGQIAHLDPDAHFGKKIQSSQDGSDYYRLDMSGHSQYLIDDTNDLLYEVIDTHISIYRYVDKDPKTYLGLHGTIQCRVVNASQQTTFKAHLYFSHKGELLTSSEKTYFFPVGAKKKEEGGVDAVVLSITEYLMAHSNPLLNIVQKIASYHKESVKALSESLNRDVSQIYRDIISYEFPLESDDLEEITLSKDDAECFGYNSPELFQKIVSQQQALKETFLLHHSISPIQSHEMRKQYYTVEEWVIRYQSSPNSGAAPESALSPIPSSSEKVIPSREFEDSSEPECLHRSDLAVSTDCEDNENIFIENENSPNLYALRAKKVAQYIKKKVKVLTDLKCDLFSYSVKDRDQSLTSLDWFLQYRHALLENILKHVSQAEHFSSKFLTSETAIALLKPLTTILRMCEVKVAQGFLDLFITPVRLTYEKKESLLPIELKGYFITYYGLLMNMAAHYKCTFSISTIVFWVNHFGTEKDRIHFLKNYPSVLKKIDPATNFQTLFFIKSLGMLFAYERVLFWKEAFDQSHEDDSWNEMKLPKEPLALPTMDFFDPEKWLNQFAMMHQNCFTDPTVKNTMFLVNLLKTLYFYVDIEREDYEIFYEALQEIFYYHDRMVRYQEVLKKSYQHIPVDVLIADPKLADPDFHRLCIHAVEQFLGMLWGGAHDLAPYAVQPPDWDRLWEKYYYQNQQMTLCNQIIVEEESLFHTLLENFADFIYQGPGLAEELIETAAHNNTEVVQKFLTKAIFKASFIGRLKDEKAKEFNKMIEQLSLHLSKLHLWLRVLQPLSLEILKDISVLYRIFQTVLPDRYKDYDLGQNILKMKHFVSWTLCCFSIYEKICIKTKEYQTIVSSVSQDYPRLFQVQTLFYTQRVLSAYYAQLRPEPAKRTPSIKQQATPVTFSQPTVSVSLSRDGVSRDSDQELKKKSNNK